MIDILDPSAFRAPAILLAGVVDYAMYQSFRDQLSRAPQKGLVVTELSTLGGDPEVARMMGEDVRLSQRSRTRSAFCFSGKGRDLFRWDDLHVVFRARQPLSDAGDASHDPRAEA
jgi:hypothetical protein